MTRVDDTVCVDTRSWSAMTESGMDEGCTPDDSPIEQGRNANLPSLQQGSVGEHGGRY